MPNEYELRVKEIIQRAYNVKNVRLEVSEPLDYKAGAVLLRFQSKRKYDYRKFYRLSVIPVRNFAYEFLPIRYF